MMCDIEMQRTVRSLTFRITVCSRGLVFESVCSGRRTVRTSRAQVKLGLLSRSVTFGSPISKGIQSFKLSTERTAQEIVPQDSGWQCGPAAAQPASGGSARDTALRKMS